VTTDGAGPRAAFATFFADVEPRLRHALVAALGADHGREATAEALAYAWENWSRLQVMDNAVGYLYRVGRTQARRLRRRPVELPPATHDQQPWVEPGLPRALSGLSERQRVVVILVCSLGWSQTEVAEALQVSLGTVHKHLNRGLSRLRTALGVDT